MRPFRNASMLDHLDLVLTSAFLFILSVEKANGWSCESESSGTAVKLQQFSLSAHNLAVCNDESSAAYFYAPSTTNHNTWLVYLSGGGQCYDQASCNKRWRGLSYPHVSCESSTSTAPCFMSAKDFPNSCSKTGIFDSNSMLNPLSGANKVYVPYCSSDAWIGNVSKEESGIGYSFRGVEIVRATLKSLMDNHGMGSTGRVERLVFAGGSAGGRGAMALCDSIRLLAPATSNLEILCYLDSAFYISEPFPAPDSHFEGFISIAKKAFKHFRPPYEVAVGVDCGTAYPDSPWRCTFGEYRAQFLKTRNLLVASQYDAWQLSHNVHGFDGIEATPNFTAAELPYVYTFGAATENLLRLLPGRLSQNGSGIFSTACYTHHVSEKASFSTTATMQGVTQAEAVSYFLREDINDFVFVDHSDEGIDPEGFC